MPKRDGPVIFSRIEAYEGLKKAVAKGKEAVLDEIKQSNLRGRGGAGFPTALKWKFALETEVNEKFVVCNADEGEPGTFKDKVLLEEYAALTFEGMIIAAFVIGAEKGYMYLRGEYKELKKSLEDVLQKMRQDNVLGAAILGKQGFNFDIEIRYGAGAYICGEETALIESMEGNRGEPRNRPPFPVNTGFLGCPTIVNNVETLAIVPHIMSKGADWFKKIGTEKSSGAKLLSISGDCKKPGVYEVEYGILVSDVLKLAGADNVKAVQVGGASGVCLTESEFERKIAFEDLPTGGSIIIFNKSRKIIDIVKNFLEFFEEESCGQCTPCREGIPVLLEGVEMLEKGTCCEKYLKDLLSLAETMQCSSKCGLGQAAPNAFVDMVNKFKGEYKLSQIPRKEKSFNA